MKPVYILVTLLVLLGRPAHADVISAQFLGTVTQVPIDEVFGDISFGDAMRGSFSFDTSAVDLVPADTAVGSYSFDMPFGMTMTIGTHQFSAVGSLQIGILNSFVDQYTVLATSPLGDITLELFLQDNTGTALTSDGLPDDLAPARFVEKDFHLDAMLANGEVQVDGQLNSAQTVAVPEPLDARLLGFGVILIGLLYGWRPRARK